MPASWASNLDDLLISQPDTGEQALEIADTLVRSGALTCLVVDSVAALVPRAELEGEMGDHCRLQARLMSQALRKLTGSISQVQDCMVIFINQIRMKIGVMFGSPETTTGGNALKFYSSVRSTSAASARSRIVTRWSATRPGSRWSRTRWRRPSSQVEFDIMYGEGVSKMGELLDLGVRPGSLTSPVPGSPMAVNGSVRGGRTPRRSSVRIPTCPGNREQDPRKRRSDCRSHAGQAGCGAG